MRSTIPILGLFLILVTDSVAQVPDSMAYRKSIIKLNLTSRILYSSAYVLSYERMMKPDQSLGITLGYMQFPPLLFRAGGMVVEREISNSGFTAGAEYRFYLATENKYPGPHGFYIGPYVNVYSFSNERLLRAPSSSQATLDSRITFTNIGFQVGYQIILNNRWSIDMIFFGPSLTNYFVDLKLNNSTFTPGEESEIVDGLLDRFPFLDDLLDGETISANGKTSKWAGGYRYTLQIGYRFGAKKNK